MPYASRRQQRWAFATRQPFAKRWAKETPSFSALPEKKDAGTEAGTPLHGPGGLLGTPGIRKWGKRKPSVTTKPMTRSEAARVAALARWGKYTPKPDAPVARGSTFSKQPKPVRQAAPKLPKAGGRKGGKKGRAAGRPKKTEAQRQAEQQAKRDQKQREREQARETARQQVYERMGIPSEGRAALEALRRGERPDPEAIARGGFVDAGLVERAADGSFRMTPSGRALTSAADAGDAGRAGDTISSSRDRLSQRRARQAEQAKRRQAAQERRAKKGGGGKKKQQSEAKPIPEARRRRLVRPQQRIADAARQAQGRTKSFTVFKDHTGAYRWIARSTTAYRDRDREILSTAALDADSQRMTATKQFGPLRWWHVGQPDPFSVSAPWGIGLDLGDGDFSMQIGTTRVESGTFRDVGMARRIAETADQYELSPGFFHAYGVAGPPDGVYHQVRTFERSLVPTRYGRASNLFTGLTVKEHRMDPNEMERRFKAAIAELRLSPEQAQLLAAGLVQTDKSAQAQGVAYKSDDAPQVYTAPDGTQGIIHEGRFVALKAAMPMGGMGDMESPEEDAGEGGIEEPGEGSGGYLGDMTPAEFWMQLKNYLAEILAPQTKMEEMAKAFASGLGELKSLYATKDTGTLKDAGTMARIQQLEAELATLKGDRPRVAEQDALAALKSGGPQAPPDPNAPQVPDDPNRPFAALGAATMPALYQTNSQGGFVGWMPPAQPPQSS